MKPIDTLSRLVQFAAILLELGGAVLIALLFALIRRYAVRHKYFSTWAWAWLAMMVAIGAVAYRYVLLGDIAGGPVPDTADKVRALYALYQCGKLLFWLLVCRGAFEYMRPDRTWPVWWLPVALLYGLGSTLASADLNALLVWQAPVAIVATVWPAIALLRLSTGVRSVGTVVLATVLAVSAALWTVYLIVFAGAAGPPPNTLGWLGDAVTSYNSYADMLMIVMLGYAMVVLFMEDARLRISDSEARLAALVSSAADAIITADTELHLLDANLAAERLLGIRRATAVGTSIEDLIAENDRARFRHAVDGFLASGETFTVLHADDEFRAIRHDGVLFTFEASASKVRSNATTSLAVVLRDVTERRELEEKKRQAQKMDTVRQLAGGLAHDFNNLLTTIVGRSQIILRALPSDSPVRADVSEIERTAGTAARRTLGLLALSRRDVLHAEHSELNDLTRSLERKIRTATPAQVKVDWRYGSDAGAVNVDAARLEEVILAVVQNAREAIGPQGGRITIETSRITSQREFGRLIDIACISISDTGPGLSREARTHLFEPFFSTRGESRGLGLAMAYAFLQQSGGWIDVQSASHGTTVRIGLPIVVGDAALIAHAGASRPAPEQRAAARRTVLVAEDEESVRRLVRVVLEREGWCVVECENGIDALSAFEKADPPVDVLLTDVVMPQMGGRELAAQLIAIRPSLRVIFMSGFVDDGALLEGFTDRSTLFLQKPFDIAELAAVVRRAMVE